MTCSYLTLLPPIRAPPSPLDPCHPALKTLRYNGLHSAIPPHPRELDFDATLPGPLTNDGHAVYAVAYDQNGVTVLTWGNTQQATWAWWDECVDEAYAILPPEAEKSGFAPGFNFAQLQTDLAAVAS